MANNIIKIPASDTATLQNELRNTVQQLRRDVASIKKITGSMAQIGDAADIESEYGLNAGQGDDVKSLITSVDTEFDSASFLPQLLTRFF